MRSAALDALVERRGIKARQSRGVTAMAADLKEMIAQLEAEGG